MRSKSEMIAADKALKGRFNETVVARPHLVLGGSMVAPPPAGSETAYLALGCFWGAERVFYQLNGVFSTSVGYQGGFTPNPSYEEVCTGMTGHAEAVKVVFDPKIVSYAELLRKFYESHDPTQGFRQGGDIGTQYRSAIYTTSEEQSTTAHDVSNIYAQKLRAAGFGPITTEIALAGPFYLAEEYHQQYLAANPRGYCGLGGTGISCPVGLPSI